MRLYDLKKVLFIILLIGTSSASLQAMSLRQLMLIMLVCSPGTKTAMDIAARQRITKIKCNIEDDSISRDRLALLPDNALVMQYPSMKTFADFRNKRFETKLPATESF